MSASPFLLPLAERLGRRMLNRRGVHSRSVETSLGRLHVYDADGRGALPTVVLLHGIGSSATPFGGVLSRLLPHVRRVIAPDYPGHGFSAASPTPLTAGSVFEAMAAALDRIVQEPALVVGNSLGGALAIRYAIERPERVRALMLASPAGARLSDEEWAALRASFELRTSRDGRAFMNRLYHRPPPLASLMARELPALMGRPAIRDILGSATNDDTVPPEALRALTLPILLWWGKSERLLPASSLAYFRQHLPPQAVIEEPEGMGHCPHFDDPAALAERILALARQ